MDLIPGTAKDEMAVSPDLFYTGSPQKPGIHILSLLHALDKPLT